MSINRAIRNLLEMYSTNNLKMQQSKVEKPTTYRSSMEQKTRRDNVMSIRLEGKDINRLYSTDR